jgi:hemerythrin-like domain-containing protein
MSTPLQALLDEHRSIGAVLHGMKYLVDAHRDRGEKLDTRVLSAMLYYLDVFPERMHHPKEETVLFARLRARTDAADAILDELEGEHAAGEQGIRDLEQALVRYIAGGEAEFEALAQQVHRFVDAYFEHIRKEEDLVLPHARKALTPEDWDAIEAAFAANADPLAGAGRGTDYRALFARIVNLAPPPIGVGPVT